VILDKNKAPGMRDHVAAALATDAAKFVIAVRSGEA
jgi:hypothetical protein